MTISYRTAPRRATTALLALLSLALLVSAVDLGTSGPAQARGLPAGRGFTAAATPDGRPATFSAGRTGTAAPAAAAVGARAARRPAPLAVLALGDSVPAGKACSCTPYVRRVAARLAAATGRRVSSDNDAVSGQDSAGMLRMLRVNRSVRSDVARAGLIIVTVGANDVGYRRQAACRHDLGCYQRDLVTMERTVHAALNQIRSIAGRRRPAIMVTGYWNVWQDGEVARRKGQSFVVASSIVTRAANAALARVAHAHGARYVDLLARFRPQNRDATHLLAADGDHPNARGHAVIARAVTDALPRPWARIGL